MTTHSDLILKLDEVKASTVEAKNAPLLMKPEKAERAVDGLIEFLEMLLEYDELQP